MAEKEIIKAIQQAADKLKETIENYLGKSCMVEWSAVNNEDKFVSGIICSDSLSIADAALMQLQLNGRLDSMIKKPIN